MTEQEHINATNATRVVIAHQLVRDLLIQDRETHDLQVAVVLRLVELEHVLKERLETEPNSSDHRAGGQHSKKP